MCWGLVLFIPFLISTLIAAITVGNISKFFRTKMGPSMHSILNITDNEYNYSEERN